MYLCFDTKPIKTPTFWVAKPQSKQNTVSYNDLFIISLLKMEGKTCHRGISALMSTTGCFSVPKYSLYREKGEKYQGRKITSTKGTRGCGSDISSIRLSLLSPHLESAPHQPVLHIYKAALFWNMRHEWIRSLLWNRSLKLEYMQKISPHVVNAAFLQSNFYQVNLGNYLIQII